MRKVRYGVIGASGIAQRRVLPAFAHCAYSELTAICSRSQEKAESLAAEYGAALACNRLDAMWEAVDAVYVATPVHCHVSEGEQVLAAGRHLLMEKPLARTAEEAERLIEAARRRPAQVMEAYMMKFHPAHVDIREAIARGDLGTVISARARLGCWYPDLADAWRQDAALGGGGSLMDLGSHLFDLLGWMLGPIRKVKAVCNTQVFRYAVEDTATVLVEFESGTHGLIEASFSQPDQVGGGVLEIIGTKGRVYAENTIGQNGTGTVSWQRLAEAGGYDAGQNGAAVVPSPVSYPAFDLYAAQLDYFSQCILKNAPPETNRLEEGVETLRWIERAYESARG